MDKDNLWKFFEEELFTYKYPDFYNQYYEPNLDYDLENGHLIRRKNLKNYMNSIKDPVFLFIGEAPGFKGMRCSGVPFVCEEQLLDNDFPINGKRSTIGYCKCEISANIYWKVIIDDFNEIFNWDAIPYHPFDSNDKSKNRTPKKSELHHFLPFLQRVIDIIDVEPKNIISIGKKPQYSLNKLGIYSTYVRHPSYGGKKDFVNGINKLLKNKF